MHIGWGRKSAIYSATNSVAFCGCSILRKVSFETRHCVLLSLVHTVNCFCCLCSERSLNPEGPCRLGQGLSPALINNTVWALRYLACNTHTQRKRATIKKLLNITIKSVRGCFSSTVCVFSPPPWIMLCNNTAADKLIMLLLRLLQFAVIRWGQVYPCERASKLCC